MFACLFICLLLFFVGGLGERAYGIVVCTDQNIVS